MRFCCYLSHLWHSFNLGKLANYTDDWRLHQNILFSFQVHAKIESLGVLFLHLPIAITVLLDWKSQISAKNPVELALVHLLRIFNLVNLYHVEKVRDDILFVNDIFFTKQFGWYPCAQGAITRCTKYFVKIPLSMCTVWEWEKFAGLCCHSSVALRVLFNKQRLIS